MSGVVASLNERIGEIEAATWDALAQTSPGDINPFVSHAFLKALEDSKSVGGKTGWRPVHLTVEDKGQVIAASPLYVKAHSYGEYVFDHSWADAFQRAGNKDRKHLEQHVLVTAQRQRRGVHDLEVLDDRFIEGELQVTRGGGVLHRVGGVHAVHFGGLEEDRKSVV